MNNTDLTLDQFKQRASKISRYLKDKGYDIPKCTIYDSLSFMFAEKNWNTLQAKLKKEKLNCNFEELKIETKNKIEIHELYLEIKHFYIRFFNPYFKIKDMKLFDAEIKKISEIINNDFDLSNYFRKISISNPLFANEFDLLGDEDVIKISMISSLDKKDELNLLTKIFLLMTTPGMLTSTELDSYISRRPIYNSRRNSLKNSNYIYIFLDEDTLIKNRVIHEKNYAFSAISANANYHKNKCSDEKENAEEENNLYCSLLDSSDVGIKDKAINLKQPLSEIISFFS